MPDHRDTRPLTSILLIVCAVLFAPTLIANTRPTIIWASDPVRPNETVLVFGDAFGGDAVAEVAVVKGNNHDRDWQKVEPIQTSDRSVKFVLPDAFERGIYASRIRVGDSYSNEILLNAPDPWWAQGDLGERASPGGWVRVLGKCLSATDDGAVAALSLLRAGTDKPHIVTAVAASPFAPRFDIPRSIAPGTYTLAVHNGSGGDDTWAAIGQMEITSPPVWPDRVFNAAQLGFSAALKAAEANGGGIIYLPRGRYRMEGTIVVPKHSVLRGEGMGLVSIYWEDLTPWPEVLIAGESFAIEDLSIYCQNMYRYLIRATGDGFGMRRVRVRANPDFMLRRSEPGGFRGRSFFGDYAKILDVVRLEDATNFEIVDCDILAGRRAIGIWNSRHGIVSSNTIRYGENGLMFEGTDRLIVEHNEVDGAELAATGNFFSTYWANAAENLYFANNLVRGAYGSDRELMTFDAAGGAYLGRLAATDGTRLTLAADPVVRRYVQNPPPSWAGAALCVLDGRGAGQYRRVTRNEGRTWEIDRPFTVTPDDTSIISIVPFRGRVLYTDNRFEDGGAVQLYGSAFDCIFSGNTGARMDGFTVWGKEAKGWSWQPSFFCQFLDNAILEGNGYGGRQAVIRAFSSVSKNHDQYAGPLNRCIIFRHNRIDNNGHIAVLGATSDAVVEHSAVRDSDRGIEVAPSTEHVLVRGNTLHDVTRPLFGAGLKQAAVAP